MADHEDGGALPSSNAPNIIPDDPQDEEPSQDTNEDAVGGESSMAKTAISLGGKRSQKPFALLDGIFTDPESDEKERVTIDITRLPALLGRSNDSDQNNPHFFGLGKKKALSRKHCTIYYRDKEGGHAEWDEATESLVYKDAKEIAKEKEYPTPKPNPHLVVEDEGLPPNGFFVIECLGKNRIVVDQTRVEQGESIVLRSGSAIRISSYQFYFLLPTDAQAKPHTIEIPLTDEEKAKTKKKTKKGTGKAAASKKRPAPVTSSSSSKKPKKAGTNTTTTTLAELETLPVEDLLEKMDEAVSKGLWDRKNQFIGATICYHAVRSAGMAAPIQEKVLQDGGVSRSDIMEWIENSEKFGGWVQQMLTNMEPRSYQAAITKSLLKSGFARTSGAGRYIKWELPQDIPLKKKKKKPAAPKPKPIKKEEEEEAAANSEKEEDDPGSDPPPEETPKEEEEEDEGSANDGEEEAGGSDANEEEDADSNESGREDTNEEHGEESESDLLV